MRAYAYDVANLARSSRDRASDCAVVEPMDVFARSTGGADAEDERDGRPVRTAQRGIATINRRDAAIRAFSEFLVMSGIRESNPVPAPRRGQGVRPTCRECAAI